MRSGSEMRVCGRYCECRDQGLVQAAVREIVNGGIRGGGDRGNAIVAGRFFIVAGVLFDCRNAVFDCRKRVYGLLQKNCACSYILTAK